MLQNNADSIKPIVPVDIIQILFRKWWLLVLGIVIGAVAGMLLHTLLPPVYQAQSVIQTNVDFGLTGELTDVEEDYMILAVGGIIRSDEVIDTVIERANDLGYALDRATFDEMAFVQRRFTEWLMIVRDEDAKTAADLAALWGDVAWEMLAENYSHALIAGQYQKALDEWSACLGAEDTSVTEMDCGSFSADEINAQIEAVADQLADEKLASHGLVAGTVLNYEQRALVPGSPTLRGRNSLVFSGGLIGFLVILVVIWIVAVTRTKAN